MSGIKELLNRYKEVEKELSEQIQENGEVFIKELFKEVFAQHQGLNKVIIRGWTPGFNDGEPCTHRQDVFIGAHAWGEYLDFEDYEMYEEFGCEGEEASTHINKECNTLSEAKEQIERYGEIIDRVYVTDFEVVVELVDGEVVVTDDDYDCGY